jgi:hypothetical protein
MNIYGTYNPIKLLWRVYLTWRWRRYLRRAAALDRGEAE